MSAATTTPPAHTSQTGKGVNFGRAIRSEWIKLRTVPSTVVLLSITLVVMVGLAVLSGWGLAMSAGVQAGMPPEQQAQMAESGGLQGAAYTVPSGGIIFGQLLIASLAVVLIASEWGTGMIRSTMVAVPKRIPALLAKNLVIAVVSFVIGVVAALLSYYVAQPFLAGEDLDFAITHDGMVASIINTGTYLALIAVISMAIGTMLRNTAGGIVTAVGLFFVLPTIVVQLLTLLADWIDDAAEYLPTNAGQQMVSVNIADDALNQWQGGLVMAAWAVGLLVISLIVAKRRDV
ncbi:ABC transporter permease [Arthrobacter castelli]|uniref:ABC transporter permease n=1 Tax=Arthrobacter castelli TaxID=271431 RepID=UPI0003FE65F4|nr:ABC transporter permease [Arthrobacter castelli]